MGVARPDTDSSRESSKRAPHDRLKVAARGEAGSEVWKYLFTAKPILSRGRKSKVKGAYKYYLTANVSAWLIQVIS